MSILRGESATKQEAEIKEKD